MHRVLVLAHHGNIDPGKFCEERAGGFPSTVFQKVQQLPEILFGRGIEQAALLELIVQFLVCHRFLSIR